MTMVKFSKNGEVMRDAFIPGNFVNLVENLFNDSFSHAEKKGYFNPKVDIIEKENEFELQAVLPGIKKEDINLELNNNKLTLSGERKFVKDEKNEKYHIVESHYGSFSRSFNLPENVNADSIKARVADGILFVTIEKADPKAGVAKIDIA